MFARLTKDGRTQTYAEHSTRVAELCRRYCKGYWFEDIAYTIGKEHDIGKCSADWQSYLFGKAGKIPHAMTGAIEIYKIYSSVKLANIVAGHHRGLYDESYLKRQLKDIEKYNKLNIKVPKLKTQELYTDLKFMFSALVDADRTDAASFDGKNTNKYDTLPVLLGKLNSHISSLDTSGEVNKVRNLVQKMCLESSNTADKGMLRLNVPCGGGKTLASMVFALNNAIKYNRDRVLYVIPYTSIIEQTCDIFRGIFGNSNVIEHHSSIDPALQTECNKLGCENWDAPIVVTTSVQFLETFYSNKATRCRKFHNIANSVIILDEAQLIPLEVETPSYIMLNDLCSRYNSLCVLSTATQPVISNITCKCVDPFDGVTLFEKDRVTCSVKKDTYSEDELIDELSTKDKVLCIVNTKKSCRRLAKKYKDKYGECYHLSTNMCGVHRSKVISHIKNGLKSEGKVIVFSTQLIEAGVDVDFPSVYREMCGIDSIVQSAGRCNREGKLSSGSLIVFTLPGTYLNVKNTTLNATLQVARVVLGDGSNVFKRELQTSYYTKLKQSHNLGAALYNKHIGNVVDYCIEEYSRMFKVIDSMTENVLVPYDDIGKAVISDIDMYGFTDVNLRKAQRYMIGVDIRKIEALVKKKRIVLTEGCAGSYYTVNMGYYSDVFGMIS